MHPFIVADIGGTNARFALVRTVGDGVQAVSELEQIKILPGADFATFSDALSAYLESLEGPKPLSACIAIASPIDGDEIHMTHLPWSFSIKQIQKQFGFQLFEVMNDFKAVAIGTSVVSSQDLVLVKSGVSGPFENRAIIGPGTGLGVSGLSYVQSTKSWLPISGLGGHVNLPAVNDFECEIIKLVGQKFDHVSAEVLISGSGLVTLYNAICEVEGCEAKTLSPAEVTQEALSESDAQCLLTLETFCAFLGTVAGNVALTFGAKGGVYIAGGIVPRVAYFIKKSPFSDRFVHKGVMSEYLSNIPVNLIVNTHVGLLGAAVWLTEMLD